MQSSRANFEDDTLSLVISLPPVTKKNSQQIVRCGNRLIPLPSKNYKQYEKDAAYFLRGNAGRRIAEPVTVTCRFFMQTHRRVDLNNLLEAATDMLVKHGVLEDDNSTIVCSHDGSRVLYDKNNPRTEIVISRFEP